MDRLVDHLFVFQGDGDIRDFPGNYSQYRLALKDDEKLTDVGTQMSEQKEVKPLAPANTAQQPVEKKKMSFKEKRAFEELEKEIADLTKEKETVTDKLNSGSLPFEDLQKLSNRIGEITTALDEKELKWLELSELAG
jgi:ATP-binding cassette subfamily F protein uup